jgi:transcription initiation factor IIE alpha subunit
MFDPRIATLIHAHEDDMVPMEDATENARGHHDASAHDPERSWGVSRRLFRCPRCGEEVVVVDKTGEPT